MIDLKFEDDGLSFLEVLKEGHKFNPKVSFNISEGLETEDITPAND